MAFTQGLLSKLVTSPTELRGTGFGLIHLVNRGIGHVPRRCDFRSRDSHRTGGGGWEAESANVALTKK